MEIERKDFGKAARKSPNRKHCESDASWCEARMNVKMGAWLCWQRWCGLGPRDLTDSLKSELRANLGGHNERNQGSNSEWVQDESCEQGLSVRADDALVGRVL